MANVWAWIVANWQGLGLAILAVDQVLVGLFPSVPIFGTLAGWLQKLLPPKQQMPIIESILIWLLKLILGYLLGRAISAVQQASDQVMKDHERNQIDAKNITAYENAKDRQDRISHALDLLNGTKQFVCWAKDVSDRHDL